jgi:hypothetical protein
MLRRVSKSSRSAVRLVDGTHIVVHQCGANLRGGAAAQAMGKTRGGRNTKLLVITDLSDRPLYMKLIPGQAYEGAHLFAAALDGRTANSPLRAQDAPDTIAVNTAKDPKRISPSTTLGICLHS